MGDKTMKMGIAQKQNISTQHRMWNKYNCQARNPVSFEKWFIRGIRTFEAKGAVFELMPGMVKIIWPGRVPILRTLQDFKREYKGCCHTQGFV
jgi:hypothetical protein